MEQTPLFHDRPMCIAAFGALLGALLGRALSAQACMVTGGVILLLFAVAVKVNKRRFALLFLLFALILFRIGLSAPVPPTPGSYRICGTVAAEPKKSRTGSDAILLKNVTLDGEEIDGRVLSYLSLTLPPVPGQQLTFSGRIRSSDPANAYLRYRGVGATSIANDADYTLSEPPGGAVGMRNRLRASLMRRITLLFPEQDDMIAAFLLGGGEIESETYERFQAAGVSHLLAISGLHVSILASAVCVCLCFSGLWTRFFLMTLFLLLYCTLTAFAPSVVRASVMFLCACLAVPLRRAPDGASSLSAAFVLIALCNPFAPFYVGFQLSFLAAFGLITISPLIRKPLRRLGSAAASTISGTLAATIGTLPSVCRFFGNLPAAAVCVNVLVLPLFSYMLIPAFGAVALSYLWLPLGRILAAPSGFVLTGLCSVIDACAGGRIAVPAPGNGAFFLWLAGMLAASGFPLRSPWARAAAAAALFLTALLVWRL